MTVSAVGQNENSKLYTVVKTTAVGAAVGYASKYMLPVTKQEDTINRRTMVNYCRKITNKARVAEIKAEGIKSKAQDVFVKMVESKDKDAFSLSGIQKKVQALGGENSAAGKEFRAIIRDVNNLSRNLTIRFAKSYHHMLKDIRPSAPFIVAGAGVGFFAGFAHNVMKTDFYA